MKSPTLLAALVAPLAATGIRIIQSNDDGWAELYARSFHDALIQSGHDAVLSAPAENKSGSASSDAEPTPRTEPCQYNSCPANSPPTGSNATNPRLNYVNAFPVTGMRFGINQFGPALWNGQRPELAVSGPNVGSNIYVQVHFSGTVGAAVYAVQEEQIPAIAFSGFSTGNLPFDTTPVPSRSLVYAELAATLVDRVVAAGKPYLPDGVFLNVNFPAVSERCARASDFKWVFSRINAGVFSARDVENCGGTRLPNELEVAAANLKGCFISVSPGDASDKTTVDAERQGEVLAKLSGLFTCLP